MAGEFDGKRVLVTGASKGIGEAVAERLREGERRSSPRPARNPAILPM
jgi:hypothetical protein